MDIKEVLDLVEFGLKYYRNAETGKRMNLMEYYSVTDLSPKDLGKVALKHGRQTLNIYLREYDDQYYWHMKPLDMQLRMRLFHSVKGRALTAEDKLTIKEKMEQENFPLTDGVFDFAARQYVINGVDSISKEQIRNRIITSFNKAHSIEGISIPVQEKATVLVK